jgi:hypothetical protein
VQRLPARTREQPEKSPRFRAVLGVKPARIRTGDGGFRAGKTQGPVFVSVARLGGSVSPRDRRLTTRYRPLCAAGSPRDRRHDIRSDPTTMRATRRGSLEAPERISCPGVAGWVSRASRRSLSTGLRTAAGTVPGAGPFLAIFFIRFAASTFVPDE